MDDKYQFPNISLLCKGQDNKNVFVDKSDELTAFFQQMEIDVDVVYAVDKVASGLYAIKLGSGVRVNRITALKQDLSIVLGAADIQIQIPIPGTQYLGVQALKNEQSALHLRELIQDTNFMNSDNKLEVFLGRTFDGENILFDFNVLSHLLVSGTTGSGKSVFLDTVLISLLYKMRPDELKFILIDTNGVSFLPYSTIPHLLIPVITESSKAVAALNWTVAEMADRYKHFANYGVRNIESYNEVISENSEYMPRIMVIIDDFADLMTLSNSEVEGAICHLAQMSKAAGIYLIISTQRPSVNVVTGLIKANIPNRVAFAMAANVDSRTVLDTGGAEELRGNGDMLFKSIENRTPIRVQGPYISDKEIFNVVGYLRSFNADRIAENLMNVGAENSMNINVEDMDEYLYDAGVLIINCQKVSIGLIQRRFRVGFNRASRIIEKLEEMGVLGPDKGTIQRDILMTLDEFEELF